MKLVVLAAPYGQLCNRLVLSAHLLAFCREHGFWFLNNHFGEYCKLFFRTAHSPFMSAPTLWLPAWLSDRLRWRLPNTLASCTAWLGNSGTITMNEIALASGDSFDLDDSNCLTRFNSNVVELKGWEFRCPKLVEKHATYIRNFFRLRTKGTENVSESLAAIREKVDIIVGVHARRGDYRHWANGKFYYSWETYAEHMRHVESLFVGRTVHFVVCSNETVEFTRDTKNVSILGRSVPEDLLTLSSSDFVIGAPSSFSTWAAFMGNTPLWHIHHALDFAQLDAAYTPAGLEWPSIRLRDPEIDSSQFSDVETHGPLNPEFN